MLFVQGTRDAFARQDLLRGLIERLADRAELHPVAGADHSFRVLKRDRRSPEDVAAEVRTVLVDWLERHRL
jgi:predicted alpha/beta-hydrolase family hydrolase